MKLCFIGGSGHYGYALDTLRADPSLTVSGIAPGAPGEAMDGLVTGLAALGSRPLVFDSYPAMLDACRPDIAVVNTWFGLSAAPVCAALRRGIAVFCEKPVFTQPESLPDICEAYRTHRAPLCAMLGLRRVPWFVCIQEAVRAGLVGEVRLVNAQKSYRLGTRPPFYADRALYGGTIPWVGIHGMDWIYSAAGRRFQRVSALHSTQANGGNGALEATALCQFTMDGGVMASLTIDYLRPDGAPSHGDDRVRVVGSRGIVESIGGQVSLSDGRSTRMLEPPADPVSVFTDFTRALRAGAEAEVTTFDSLYLTSVALCARGAADTGVPAYLSAVADTIHNLLA